MWQEDWENDRENEVVVGFHNKNATELISETSNPENENTQSEDNNEYNFSTIINNPILDNQSSKKSVRNH